MVIAIIAILASMLLPSLAKARDKARTIDCLNNQKSLSLYMMMYELDWNDILFPTTLNITAAFNIATFVIWQNSPVDSAFYYGCGRAAWSVQYPSRRFNKNYYSLLMMRDMVYDFPNQVAVSGGTTAQRAIAGISDDGSKAAVLVADFCGAEMTIPLEVKGFENPSAISCMVLDDLRDNERIECHQDESGLFLLEKSEPGSAVFLLVLEK